MIITSSGSSIVGSVYSLVCAVKVVDGLVVVPDVVWMKDGRVLVNGTNTTLTRTGINTLNLTFNPFLTSHGGQYLCMPSTTRFSSITNSTAINIVASSKSIFSVETFLYIYIPLLFYFSPSTWYKCWRFTI